MSDVRATLAVLTPRVDKIDLVWIYEPHNAAINKIECFYLSNPIQRVYTLTVSNNERHIGDKFLKRINHVLRNGFFNLTLQNPTREDTGFYECEFQSESTKIRKAKLSLICKYIPTCIKPI